MYFKSLIAVALILLVAGILIPLWYVSIIGLLLLSILVPIAGVFAGFFLDIIYGPPAILPTIVAFPCLLAACITGLVSFFMRTYIR